MSFLPLAQDGLEEVTSDITKLVNLRVLNLATNRSVTCIPEEISCLQKLEHLTVERCPVHEMPASLSTLSNLISFQYRCHAQEGPGFRSTLQVMVLEHFFILELMDS